MRVFSITTPRMVGVTDSGEAGGGRTVVIWTYIGETLTLPTDWQLTPPVSGEAIATYWDRAVFGHPLVQEVLRRGALMPGGLKRPRVHCVNPTKCTLEWWSDTYPYKQFDWIDTRRQALEYYLELIVWRLTVELLNRLKARDLWAIGRRTDVLESPVEPVPLGSWHNPDMVFCPSSGIFRYRQPSQQRAWSFIDLTLTSGNTAAPHVPPLFPTRRGTGLDFRASTRVLAEEILRGVSDAKGRLLSDWDASWELAPRAEGKGERTSKQKRLSHMVGQLRREKSCLRTEPND